MNPRAMPRSILLALSAFAATLLAACQPPAPAEPPPLEGARIGGDFTLLGEDRSQVRWSDFDGQYRIVYFGYTWCPDVCPVDTQRLMQGLNAFAEEEPALAERIQPLFITVDPERDTPEKLAEFTDAFHPRLIGLTGTDERLAAVRKDFGIEAYPGEPDDNGNYLVGHTNIAYLFGPDGEPLATLPHDLGPEAVADELAKWVA